MTKYRINRREVTEEEFREHGRRKGGIAAGGAPMCGNCQKWPQVSVAAGVHPDQVPEAEAHAASVGVPTKFTKDGDPILESKGHANRFFKTHFEG